MRIAMISAGAPVHAQNLVGNLTDLEGHEVTFYDTHPGPIIKPIPGLTLQDTLPMHQYSHIDWSKVDALWNMGYFFNVDQLFKEIYELYPEIKIINHWIGTDILNTITFLTQRPACEACILHNNIDLHLVDDRVFQQELMHFLKLKALFVPTLPGRPMPFTPLPEQFAVGAYVPFHRKEFYRFANIFQVAQQFPDVPIYIFSFDKWELEGVPPNIFFTGPIQSENKEEVWGKCSVFISIPIHGGLGVTAIEMAQMGRHVITDKDYPHTHKAESVVDMCKIIKDVREHGRPNKEGSDYYLSEYSKETLQKYVQGVLKKIE